MLCFQLTHDTDEAYVHFSSKNVNAMQQGAMADTRDSAYREHKSITINNSKNSKSTSKSKISGSCSNNSFSSLDSVSK